MEVAKQSKKKKKDRKSLAEVHQKVTFKIEPSDAKIENIDSSDWPLLLKVRLCWRLNYYTVFCPLSLPTEHITLTLLTLVDSVC